VAWADPATAAAWVGRADDPAATIERFADSLDATRARGYAVELQSSPRGQVRELAEALAVSVSERDRERLVERLLVEVSDPDEPLLGTLEPGRAYQVGAIDAPVFGGQGEVVLALSASSFAEPLGSDDIGRIGERVRAAAVDITASLGGH
jgi:DNA-binding IclR family transcriptional regulator